MYTYSKTSRAYGLFTLEYYSGYPANRLPRLPWLRISASVNRALEPPSKNIFWNFLLWYEFLGQNPIETTKKWLT